MVREEEAENERGRVQRILSKPSTKLGYGLTMIVSRLKIIGFVSQG